MIDFEKYVIVGIILKQSAKPRTSQLGMVCAKLENGNWGDTPNKIRVETFPARSGSGILREFWDMTMGLSAWLISTYERKDCEGWVYYFQLEEGFSPERAKLPGKWRKMIER